MAIKIVPHSLAWKDQVAAFNTRMRDAGSPWGFYVDALPTWIPKTHEEQASWREYWLCVEDDQHVRGGFALKPQRWRIAGQDVIVTDWQGPFTEGAIDKRYAALGLRIVRDMLKKRPMLFSWGHGAVDAPMLKMVAAMGWLVKPTPVAIRVIHPHAFLRRNRLLRDQPGRRFALDVLAWSGLGTLGLGGLHQAMRLTSGRLLRADFEEVASFGEWADKLWLDARDQYRAIADRSADAMNTLLPPGEKQAEWSPVTRLMVKRAERTIGWVTVTCAALEDDARFGDLTVGCLVDYFAHPDDARYVIAAGFRALRKRGADVVFANQSDPRWLRAFRENGFLLIENKRLFAASPQLATAIGPADESVTGFPRGKSDRGGLFLTNMDGHGPQGL